MNILLYFESLEILNLAKIMICVFNILILILILMKYFNIVDFYCLIKTYLIMFIAELSSNAYMHFT